MPANIGNQGMTPQARETLAATPMGSFTLTEAFGRAGNPGTRLPYFKTDLSDYWVADAGSPHYNTHYRCASNCPFDTGAGENLYRVGYIYTYAVVMDYNRFPVRKGAGSAFFLHVTAQGHHWLHLDPQAGAGVDHALAQPRGTPAHPGRHLGVIQGRLVR